MSGRGPRMRTALRRNWYTTPYERRAAHDGARLAHGAPPLLSTGSPSRAEAGTAFRLGRASNDRLLLPMRLFVEPWMVEVWAGPRAMTVLLANDVICGGPLRSQLAAKAMPGAVTCGHMVHLPRP